MPARCTRLSSLMETDGVPGLICREADTASIVFPDGRARAIYPSRLGIATPTPTLRNSTTTYITKVYREITNKKERQGNRDHGYECSRDLSKRACRNVRFGSREIEIPPPPNVPYSLALFLVSPKKKGKKEGRRSARGRFFHESRQRRRQAIVPYVRIRPHDASMLDGTAWKNPHLRHRAGEGCNTRSREQPRAAYEFVGAALVAAHVAAREVEWSSLLAYRKRRDLPPIPRPEGRGKLSWVEDLSIDEKPTGNRVRRAIPRFSSHFPLGEGAGGRGPRTHVVSMR